MSSHSPSLHSESELTPGSSSSNSPSPLLSTNNLSIAAPYLTNPSKTSPKGKEKDLAPPPPSSTPITRKDRLYIGNLHPSIDEYTLLQIFGKYGKVAHLDFLFHKVGALKGKPRGYAFLEYATKEDALRALVELNDKPFRGRKLVVTFAHQAPIDPNAVGARRPITDTTRPTALSLLKTSRGRAKAGTDDKIKAMEAKLAQLTQQPKPPEVKPDSLPDKPLPSLILAAEKEVVAASMRFQSRPPSFQMPTKPSVTTPPTTLPPRARCSVSGTGKHEMKSLPGVRIIGKR